QGDDMTIRQRVRPHYHRVVRRPAIRTAASALRRIPISSTTFGPAKRAEPSTAHWVKRYSGPPELRPEYIHLADADKVRLPDPASVEPGGYYERYEASNQERKVTRGPDGHLYCQRTPKFVLSLPQGRALGPEGGI